MDGSFSTLLHDLFLNSESKRCQSTIQKFLVWSGFQATILPLDIPISNMPAETAPTVCVKECDNLEHPLLGTE